jgi:dihydroneopterin aldolase
MTVVVEVEGLEVFGHHGAEGEEQQEGQRFLFDVRYETDDSALSDRLDDAVDYRAVIEVVTHVSTGRRFTLLEALAAAVADAIVAELPVQSVRVRVRKPDVKLPVAFTAATVERTA